MLDTADITEIPDDGQVNYLVKWKVVLKGNWTKIRDDLSFETWGIYLLSHVEDRLENVEMHCSRMCLDW